jgi:hypothetical protein
VIIDFILKNIVRKFANSLLQRCKYNKLLLKRSLSLWKTEKKLPLYTLGCKLNFQEPLIARSFEDEGFDRVDFEEVADMYVINTPLLKMPTSSLSKWSKSNEAQ